MPGIPQKYEWREATSPQSDPGYPLFRGRSRIASGRDDNKGPECIHQQANLDTRNTGQMVRTRAWPHVLVGPWSSRPTRVLRMAAPFDRAPRARDLLVFCTFPCSARAAAAGVLRAGHPASLGGQGPLLPQKGHQGKPTAPGTSRAPWAIPENLVKRRRKKTRTRQPPRLQRIGRGQHRAAPLPPRFH